MMNSSDTLRSDLPKNSHDTPIMREKPTVVGIYGIQGAGKTTLHNSLKKELGERDFLFFDGSDVIASIVDGGLDVFKSMKASEKSFHRGLAIQEIGERCLLGGRIGIVTGHATFWSEEEQTAYTVYTETDLQTYTHMLHLEVDPKTICLYRQGDANLQRFPLSVPILHQWQEIERATLQDVCRAHGILLSTLPDLSPDDKTAHVALLIYATTVKKRMCAASCADLTAS